MAIISRNRKIYVITRDSNLGDMLVAYGFASREQVAAAERASEGETALSWDDVCAVNELPKKDQRAAEILCSLGQTTLEQIKHAAEMLNYYHRYDNAPISH